MPFNCIQPGIKEKLTNKTEEPDLNSQRIQVSGHGLTGTKTVYNLNGCIQNENGDLKFLTNLCAGPKTRAEKRLLSQDLIFYIILIETLKEINFLL